MQVDNNDAAGPSSSAAAPAAAGDEASQPVSPSLSVPLLDKKAGIRDAGLIFVSESKSWLAGLLLVVVSGLVLSVTLLTVMLG